MGSFAQADQNERILAARAGDQCAFEELLKCYTPLIESLTSVFANTAESFAEHEDLRQEACIAFYNAVEKFDLLQTEVAFGAYAKICIRNRLISCLRSASARCPVVTLEEKEAPTDAQTDPAQELLEQESYRALYSRIEDALSPYESRVWWLYVSGRTAAEIAQHVMRDERSVQNAIYRIRKKLRSTLPCP